MSFGNIPLWIDIFIELERIVTGRSGIGTHVVRVTVQITLTKDLTQSLTAARGRKLLRARHSRRNGSQNAAMVCNAASLFSMDHRSFCVME